MNIGQAFSMAIKSIRNNKARSILTMLGIIIGVAAVITLVTIIQGYQKEFIRQVSDMGTNVVQVSYYYDQRDVSRGITEKARSMPEYVQAMTPNQSNWYTVKLRDKSRDSRIIFGSEQYDICTNYNIEKGSMFTYNNVLNADRVCVIGQALKNELFNFENPIGKTVHIQGEKFRVVGVLEEKNMQWGDYYDNICIVPYTNNRLLMKNPSVSEYVIQAVDGEATKAIITEMENYFKQLLGRDWGYWIYSENQFMEFYNEQIALMSLIGGGIAGISLVVGGIGIMNIMLVSVTERTREIGIRKSIGARRFDIISQFLIESGTLSLCGGLLGILLGALLSLIFGRLIFKDLVLLPSLFIVVGAAGFSIVLGMFFGFYPANRASKLNPIDALRVE
ncbi:MAG: FtsX-like permease family protein [Clostridiales bacterium]|nr:FtsX-like permease family protein [Clostridiales bacterium]